MYVSILKERGLAFVILPLALAFLTSCTGNAPESSSASVVPSADTLREYEQVVDSDNLLLDSPVFIKMDPYTGHLFLYDNGPKIIFELNEEFEVVNRYGGSGGGPGELSQITGLVVNDSLLFAHDPRDFFIHRYNRQNEEIETYNYGQRTADPDALPQMGTIITNYHPSNNRAVTLQGNILRPSHDAGEYLYDLVDWEGNHLAYIAPVPAAYQADLETEAYRQALENGEVPATDLHRAFPVNDRAEPDEIFLVYSALPKIEKYDSSGKKLWEAEVTRTPELDSLRKDHQNFMQALQYTRQMPLQTYAWGTSGPEGALYLATYTNMASMAELRTLWVHRFSPDGELTHRFALPNTKDTVLLPYVAVDTGNSRILTVSLATGQIRAYPFQL